jgi:neutral ceramidase
MIGCIPDDLWVQLPEVVQPTPPGEFVFGAYRVDLTPPPGYPTGGYGPAGSLARGRWSRLYARAFFFQDATGKSIALVSCDLFAIPEGLHDEVARRVAAGGVSLSPEAIVIAAQHTHHGPGNYLTSRGINSFGSAFPGFDRDLFDHLAGRIADAVLRAVRSAHGSVSIRVRVGQFDYSLLRNRSPFNFMLNRDANEILQELAAASEYPEPRCGPGPGEPNAGWDIPGCPRLRAVDRRFTTLEVWRGRQRAGLLVFLAMHPTVLHYDTGLYSADLFGYASSRLERDWSDPNTVVGIFNGAEGDVVVRRDERRRGLQNVVAAGLRLYSAIRGSIDEDGVRELDLDGHAVRFAHERYEGAEASCTPPEGVSIAGCPEGPCRLARKPRYGAPAFGGAEGDRTSLWDLGWREGVRDVAQNGQGPKLPALDSKLLRAIKLTDVLAPPESFPRHVPVTYANIGGFSIGAVPSEVGTAQGWRIRRTLGRDVGDFALVGLADGYIGYTVTGESYAAQDYMGGSTIWGPEQGPFLSCALHALMMGAGSHFPQVRHARRYVPAYLGERREFRAMHVGDRPAYEDDQLERALLDSKGRPRRDLPRLVFETDTSDAWRAPFYPNVEVRERLTDGTWRVRRADSGADDDYGFNLVLVLLEQREESRHWAALWIAPLRADGAGLAGEFQLHATFAGRMVGQCTFTVPGGRCERSAADADQR